MKNSNIKWIGNIITPSRTITKIQTIRWIRDNTCIDIILNGNQIENQLKHRDIMGFIIDTYSKEYRDNRHKRLLSETKIGCNNPMYNLCGEHHPNYKELVADGHGYLMILKPEWYTSRLNAKHIYYHHYVMCMYMGLSEIPQGMVVHHIDFDKTNNNIDNLALMTNCAHSKLHQVIKKM